MIFDPGQNRQQWRHSRPGTYLTWESAFVRTLGTDWKTKVASTNWKKDKGKFRTLFYEIFGTQAFEERFCKRRNPTTPTGPVQKRKRIAFREPMIWGPCVSQAVRLEVCGDSKLVINWLNGTWRCRWNVYQGRLGILHKLLEDMTRT
eukprot:1601757-Karenia_brevis.AAC.1